MARPHAPALAGVCVQLRALGPGAVLALALTGCLTLTGCVGQGPDPAGGPLVPAAADPYADRPFERPGADLGAFFSQGPVTGHGPFRIEQWIARDEPAISPAGTGNYVLVIYQGEQEILRRHADMLALQVQTFTGEDLTGDGSPELVLEGWTGGANCCTWLEIYGVSAGTRLLLGTEPGSCGGMPQDLDGDGRYEVLACDSAFAREFCSFAESPFPPVVYAVGPDGSYELATPRFAALLPEPPDQRDEALEPEEEFGPTEDPAAKCRLLSPALELVYTGRYGEGLSLLEENYRAADAAEFLARVRAILDRSSLWLRSPGGDSPVKIAVTAASGRLGHAILRHLVGEAGPGTVLAVARDPARVTLPGIEVRAGDYGSVAAMGAAFAGVDRAIMISAPVVAGTDRVALHRNVIAAARQAGVGWLVFTSVIGNGRELATWFGPTQQVNRQTETDLQTSGLGWTIARNGLYLDLDLIHIRRAHDTGGVYANPGGEGRCGYLTIDEIAFATARLILDPAHQGQVYNVVGDCWTQAEIVAAACRVFGLTVCYEQLRDEANVARFLKLMPQRGEVVARMLTGAFQSIRAGAYEVPSDFARITGRPAKSLTAMLEDLRAATS